MGELGKLPRPEEVGAGVARMAEVDCAAPHQRADRRGAHPGQRLLVGGFLEHEAVGVDGGPFSESFLLPRPALGVLLLKDVLNDVARPLRGFAATFCAAHAVTDQRPYRPAGQFPGPVIVLIS